MVEVFARMDAHRGSSSDAKTLWYLGHSDLFLNLFNGVSQRVDERNIDIVEILKILIVKVIEIAKI